MIALFEPFTPPDLFTLVWVGALVVLIGSMFVYSTSLRRYRRCPAILALHEWVFWSQIAEINDEIRRQRFVRPPRRDPRERARPTPAGRRPRHR